MSNQESLFQSSDVSVKSNWLFVDDKNLRTQVLRHSPEKTAVDSEQTKQLLMVGRFAILNGIVNFPAADTTPSIWTLHLGVNSQTEGRDSKLFTEKGYKNGGVNEAIDEIKAPFHPYWQSIKAAGFRPEVRRTSGKKDGGAWMLLRQPELMQVAEDWLDFREEREIKSLRSVLTSSEGGDMRHSPDGVKRYILNAALTIQQDYIEYQDDRLRSEEIPSERRREYRARQQVGSLIADLALKQVLNYTGGQEEDIDDVLTSAKNNPFIDESTVLAIENATY